MTQITHGVKAVLSHPYIYSSFQSLMGADKLRRNFVSEYVKPFPNMRVLDIGCGTADILAYLPNVDYAGFDISSDYIRHARKRFGARGKFYSQQLHQRDLEALPLFDVVLALGLLHHLDDEIAMDLMQLASKALKPNGRLLTFDPCLEPSQHPIARLLVLNDRGKNVRDKTGYETLAKSVFESPSVEVRHRAWIPYTHCFMECRKYR